MKKTAMDEQKNWKQKTKKTKVSERKKPKPKGIYILGFLLSIWKIFWNQKISFCNFIKLEI